MNGPILAIGLPVYQGGSTLVRALDSLRRQEFQDWVLTIADNASTDDTAEIARAYAAKDERIRHVRHGSNLGAAANFLFLARSAQSPYFMWAAADDEWSPNYLAACLDLLEAEPATGFAGGSVINVDPAGAQLRAYGAFRRLDSASPLVRVGRYVASREIDGKANVIYSVFRSELIRDVCSNDRVMEGWGADMGLVAAALYRAPYRQVTGATLYKRVASQDDIATSKAIAAGRYADVEFGGNFPPGQFQSYLDALLRGVGDRQLRRRIIATMRLRLAITKTGMQVSRLSRIARRFWRAERGAV